MSRFNPFNKKTRMTNKDQELHNEANNNNDNTEHNIEEAAMNFNSDDRVV